MLLLYLKMPTIIMNNLKLDCVLSTTIITKTNILFLNLILLSVLFLVSINSQNFNHANASTSLGESIKQFQENLQSNINKQIQSSTNNNNNNNNCDNNNNIIVQSQTNNNGKNTIISKNLCGILASITSGSTFSNPNLNGIIVSTEFNTTTGIIVNSLFGNWSLTTKDDGFLDFNSLFTRQPIFYTSTDSLLSNNPKNNFNTKNDIAPITSSPANSVDNGINSPLYAETNSNDQMVSTTQQQQKGHDLISYSLSDFNINSIIRQNSDTTFVGKMDVVKETKSMDANRLLKKDAFYNVGASLSILNNRVVIINFDSQTTLFNDFKYTPLVG